MNALAAVLQRDSSSHPSMQAVEGPQDLPDRITEGRDPFGVQRLFRDLGCVQGSYDVTGVAVMQQALLCQGMYNAYKPTTSTPVQVLPCFCAGMACGCGTSMVERFRNH